MLQHGSVFVEKIVYIRFTGRDRVALRTTVTTEHSTINIQCDASACTVFVIAISDGNVATLSGTSRLTFKEI